MKKTLLISAFSIFFVLALFSADLVSESNPKSGTWKAGVARVMITPEQSMWMAGYAARDHQAEGTLHDLWAKALALEDAGTSAIQLKKVALNDDEMGHLSLKVTGRPSVASETPAIVRADGEETGYFSLDGAHFVETTGGQPAQVRADDNAMGFLSLKVAGQVANSSETPVLAQGQ